MERIGIVVFPGSNCDRDVHRVLNHDLKIPADLVWHANSKLSSYDSFVIPGGFSYGDHLRAGAIAAHTPAVEELKKKANKGRMILGICNGFQILVECGLLPGALVTNKSLCFICGWTNIRVETNTTAFTSLLSLGQTIKIPIAHGQGRYIVDKQILASISKKNQVVFRYCQNNPNGSTDSIAAVCNEDRNVMGIMPHPERVPAFGIGHEASLIFRSLWDHLTG
jgi:phosphoribosylformylglycinamidine synthase I